jgi:elongation factor Ts
MEITASMVRDLREQTGAGLMECKRALEATNGNAEAAVDHLRKQGLKSAEKKAAREMGEGRVHAVIAPKARAGALLALTCETDFVPPTADFQGLLKDLTAFVLEHDPKDVAALTAMKWPKTGTTVGEAVKLLVGKIGENIQVARFARFANPAGRVASYIHHNQKVGVLVSVTTDTPEDKTAEVLRELCMHVAMYNPLAVSRAEIPASEIERERAIYLEEVKGKPAEMQEKIAAGKLEKFYADRVLPEQKWVKDDSKTVQKVLADALGKGAKIEAFSRIQIGK